MHHRSWARGRTRLIVPALLMLACGADEAPGDVSAPGVRNEAARPSSAEDDFAADLIQEAEEQLAAFEQEVQVARTEMAKLEAQGRERLSAALERAEEKRQQVGDWLVELEGAATEKAAQARSKLSAGLEDLAEARRELTQTLREGSTQS